MAATAPATASNAQTGQEGSMASDEEGGAGGLAGLTDKQREVLDLLIEHKTSKEIARLLGISPHTVDQRIFFAKEKLGAASRNEAAAAYRRLVAVSGRTTYQYSHIAGAGATSESSPGLSSGQVLALGRSEPSQPESSSLPELDFRVVPEWFDGRNGTLVRLGAIIAIAVCLVIVVLGGLAIFSTLSELMAA
jgi:DNA-binding CsgD family transcriptional regulator